MKKRFLSIILALTLIASAVPFAVFADCAHSKTHHEVEAATCVAGTDKVVCDDCGTIISTTVLQPTEDHLFIPNINNGNCLKCNGSKEPCKHTEFEVQKEDPATCVQGGYIWKKCNLCNTEFNHETPVDKNNHINFNDGVCAGCEFVCPHAKTHIESVGATCAVEGYSKVICDLCKKVMSEETLEKTNDHIFLTNHEEGKKCLVCNADKQDVCEHDYKIVDEEEGTCTSKGYAWKECELCGKLSNSETDYNEENHINFVDGVCAGCDYVCPHAKTYIDSVAATCAVEGYSKEICELCEKVLSEETLEKTNEHLFLPQYEEGEECCICHANKQDVCEHDFEVDRATPGNCTVTGYAWEICKLCGLEYNHETPVIPSAHNFVNGKCATCFKPCECDMEYQDIKMSTCKEEGYRRVRCLKCDKILSETILEKSNEHLFLPQYENGTKCRICDANKQDVCEHDYEITKEQAGTCIEAGYVWKECKLCGKEYNHETEIDPDGHDYMVTKQEEATCVEPAHVWKRCVLCADQVDMDEGAAAGHKFVTGKCTVCGEPDPDCPHANHTENTAKYQAPTCTEDGIRYYLCPDCGTEQTETVEKLGHVRVESVSAPTCTENGTRYINCTRCRTLLDTEVIPATGHTFVGGTCDCGAADPDACIHPENMHSTQTQEATCTSDGYIRVVCEACGDVLSTEILEATGHIQVVTVVPATCTQKGSRTVTCSVCQEKLGSTVLGKLPHNYENGVCTGCGSVDSSKYTSDFQDVFLVGED